MGILRILLALSVVMVHTYPLWGYDGISEHAVNSFFVISGFYMALILSEKYIKKNGSYRLFITNRFLRIYPLYWAILLLVFAFSLYKFFLLPGSENYITYLLNFLSHSPHFGLDIFATIWRNISLIFTTDYFLNNFTEPGYLLIQPAWTLQVELIFYLMVPFLLRIKTPLLLVLAIIFSVITFGFKNVLSPNDSSLTLIFVTRFVFFLFGIFSYKLYALIKTRKQAINISPLIYCLFPLFALIFGGFFIKTIPPSVTLQIVSLCYYLLLTVAIAFIFIFSNNKKLDTAIGELSYPIYLSHQFVFKIISTVLIGLNHELITILTLFATLIFSFFLVEILEKPIDHFRHSLLR